MLVCSCPLRILWISVSKLENSSGHCLPWFNQRPGRGSAGLLQLYRLHRAQTRHQLHKSPLPWKRLYLKVWVHYFHKSHILNELQLIQNMMLVNSKLPKTFEIITQMSDSVFFPMVPPLHIGWKTDGRLIESGVSFYPILLYFTM